MTYVIAVPCAGVKDGSCVSACPVDAIHPKPDEIEYATAEQLYINPDECVDCDACLEECPVDAIYPENEVPDEWRHSVVANAAYYDDRIST